MDKEVDWHLFSQETESLVNFVGPRWCTIRASDIIAYSGKKLLIKKNVLSSAITFDKEHESKLTSELGRYLGTTDLANVYVHLDSLHLTNCCSKTPFDASVCPYCAMQGKRLRVLDTHVTMIRESRGGANFFRVILDSHNVPRERALVILHALNNNYPDYAFYIPASERYGCSVLRAIASNGEKQVALNNMILASYSDFKKLSKRKKWPIAFPISLFTGKAALIIRTLVECLSLRVPLFNYVVRCEARLKNPNMPFSIFIGDFIPNDMLINLGMAAMTRPTGTVCVYNSYVYETISTVSDLARVIDVLPVIERCPCGAQRSEGDHDGWLSKHILTCCYFNEKIVRCGCGTVFTPRERWAYVDHISTCLSSGVREVSLRKSDE